MYSSFPGANLIIDPQNVVDGDLAFDVFIDLDGSYSLDANVCGEGNIYSWQKNIEDNWVDIPNASKSSHNISKANVNDNGEYRCKVGNAVFKGISLYSRTYNVIVNPDLAPEFAVSLTEDHDVSFFIYDYYDKSQMEAFQLLFSDSKFLSFEVLENTSHGQFEITNASSFAFKYTPVANYFGDDLLTYRMFNTDLDLEFIGKMNFSILPLNDKPSFFLRAMGSDVNVTTLELDVKYGETVQFMAALNDDTDGVYACALEVKKTSATLGGKITYNGTSKIITYTPVQNVTATDILTLTAKETCTSPLSSEVRIVRVNIEEKIENDTPQANDKIVNTLQDKLIEFSLPASDTETAVENLIVNVLSGPDHAQFFTIENGIVYYRSEYDFEGTDEVVFEVLDEKGASSQQATISFHVSAPTYSEYPLLIDTTIIQYNGIKSLTINNTLIYNFDLSVDWFETSALDSLANIENGYAIFFPDSALKPYFDIDNRHPYSHLRIKPLLVNFFMFKYGQDDYLNELNLFLTGKTVTIGYCQLLSNDTLAIQEFQLVADSSRAEEIDAVTIPGTLLTTFDTVKVRSESTDTLFIEAASLSNETTMEIISAPTLGAVNSFEIQESLIDFITVYRIVYQANAIDEPKYDSIIYLVQNNIEASYGKLIIEVLPSKSAPQIVEIGNISMKEDEVVSLKLKVTDADNLFDELYFSFEINSISDDFYLQRVDSLLWIYPPENFSGSATVVTRVIDPDFQVATRSFSVNVMPQNDLPEISIEGDTTIKYDQPFHLLISTSDVEESQLTLTANQIPSWTSFSLISPGIGELFGQPQLSDEGKYTVEFHANDGQDETIRTVTIKILGEKIDQAPVVSNPIAPIDLPKEANPMEIDLATIFSDPDGDALSFSVNSNSNSKWLSAKVEGDMLTLSIVDKNYTGLATISVKAQANELSASTSFLVYTTDQVPKLNTPISNITVWKNAKPISISLANTFIDPDGDALGYRVLSNSNPSIVSAIVEGSSVVLNFIEGAGGSSVIYVQASAYGKTVKTAFTVTIKDASPVIKTPIDDINVSKNETKIEVDVSNLFEDADDSLVVVKVDSYSNTTLISSADVVNNQLLVVNFNPFQIGESAITLSGNSNDKSTKYSFTITVEDLAPVVKTPLADITVFKNESPVEVDISNLFEDPDDLLVEIKIESYSNSALISSAEIVDNQLLIVNLNNLQAGESTITLSGISNDQSIQFTLNLKVEDRAPVVVAAFPELSLQSTDNPVTYNLNDYFEDADGDPITYSIASNSNEQLIKATISDQLLTVVFNEQGGKESGSGTLEIKATSDEASISSNLQVTILNGNAVHATGLSFIQVGPNPTSDFINILIVESEAIPQIFLYNLAGENLITTSNLHQIDKRNYRINMEGFVTGAYIVNVKLGNTVYYEKLLKKE